MAFVASPAAFLGFSASILLFYAGLGVFFSVGQQRATGCERFEALSHP